MANRVSSLGAAAWVVAVTKRRAVPMKKKKATAGRGVATNASHTRPDGPGPRPRRVVKMAVKKPASPVAPSWPGLQESADRVTEFPDGAGGVRLSTMRQEFPGLYRAPPPSVGEVRYAARVAGTAVTMRAADWPVPCPSVLCNPRGPAIGGMVGDPTHPTQQHHYFCEYWDQTGATPF